MSCVENALEVYCFVAEKLETETADRCTDFIEEIAVGTEDETSAIEASYARSRGGLAIVDAGSKVLRVCESGYALVERTKFIW